MNLTCEFAELTANTGDSRYELPIVAGSLVNAELGALFGPVALVVQSAGGPAPSLVDAHPAGSAGAVTPSKFCDKLTAGVPSEYTCVTFCEFIPSCTSHVSVIVPPQTLDGSTTNVKLRVTAGPPNVSVP